MATLAKVSLTICIVNKAGDNNLEMTTLLQELLPFEQNSIFC
jgi:hypothetical protein